MNLVAIRNSRSRPIPLEKNCSSLSEYIIPCSEKRVGHEPATACPVSIRHRRGVQGVVVCRDGQTLPAFARKSKLRIQSEHVETGEAHVPVQFDCFCAPSTGSPILSLEESSRRFPPHQARHGRQAAILLGREDPIQESQAKQFPGTVRAAFILFPLGQFGATNTKATVPSEPGNPIDDRIGMLLKNRRRSTIFWYPDWIFA